MTICVAFPPLFLHYTAPSEIILEKELNTLQNAITNQNLSVAVEEFDKKLLASYT